MDDKELDDMAKDIEPTKVEAPNEVETKPGAAPTGFVEDKETYVKPDGETTSTPARNLIKEESGAAKWVVRGLATVVILGLGAGSAWLYTDAQNARNELQSIKTGLETARSDAAKLRDEVKVLKAEPAKEVQEVVKTDKELAAEVVKATIHAPVAAKNAKVTVNIMKQNKDFAYASAGFEEGGGAAYILKKVDNLWIVVFSGQDKVSEDTVKEFAIPAEYQTGQ